jgi:hypothetical protein
MANGQEKKYDPELTFKSSDRYFNIPADVLAEDTAKILAAIDNWSCTLIQIKKHAGFEPFVDISEILEYLQDKQKIKKVYNGSLTAFFRAEKIPTKFWLAGNNQVAADFTPLPEIDKSQFTAPPPMVAKTSDDKFDWKTESLTPEYVQSLAELGLPTKPQTAKHANIPIDRFMKELQKRDLENAWNTGRRNLTEKNNEEDIMSNVTGRPRLNGKVPEIKVAEADVEKYAGETKDLKDTAAQKIIAEKLGMGFSTLNNKFKKYPNLKAAYNRGRGKEVAEPKSEEIKLTTVDDYIAVIEAEIDEDFKKLEEHDLYQGLVPTDEDIAAWTSLSNPLPVSQPDEPKAKFVEAVPVSSNRHTEVLAKIKPEKNVGQVALVHGGHIGHERFNESFNGEPLRAPTPTETISFGNGGEIQLFAELNLFQMDEYSRNFVNRLISDIQDFKAKKSV